MSWAIIAPLAGTSGACYLRCGTQYSSAKTMMPSDGEAAVNGLGREQQNAKVKSTSLA